jgi:hypothetical protein
MRSSTKKIRHKNDFYETPGKLTRALLKQVDISGTILEPCAGLGAITSVLKENNPHVLESDMAWADIRNHPTDATTNDFWVYWQQHFKDNYPGVGLQWVVTNPPFNKAHLILPLAFEHCDRGVAFLLRSSYTEPCKNRADWLVKYADNFRMRLDINPRPQFRQESGSDMVTVSWFVWDKHWSWNRLGAISPFGFITNWN